MWDEEKKTNDFSERDIKLLANMGEGDSFLVNN